MIHKQQLPKAEFKDLRRIFHFQIRLLLWVLCKGNEIELELSIIQEKFGNREGRWLFQRLCRGPKKTSFGAKLETLLQKAIAAPKQAKNTAKAIWNDIQFVKNWGTSGYEMKFPTLPDQWQKAVHDVCIPFYENWLSNSGFKKNSFNISSTCLDRKCLLKAYRPHSNGVCSYCDGPLGDVGQTKEANDCEHFFPKSKFPHLCLHPCNLFVSCKGCNETWKIDNAPMGVADQAGLYGTYHPQLRPGAQSLVVDVIEDSQLPYSLELRDNNVPRRVTSLNTVLDLNCRWTNHINERLRSNISELIAESLMVARRHGAITEQEINQIIADKLFYLSNNIGKSLFAIRNIAVLHYQQTNQLAALLRECV